MTATATAKAAITDRFRTEVGKIPHLNSMRNYRGPRKTVPLFRT